MSRAPDTWILTADCPSMLGTVDVVTRYLFEQRCYVTEHHSSMTGSRGASSFASNSASRTTSTRRASGPASPSAAMRSAWRSS